MFEDEFVPGFIMKVPAAATPDLLGGWTETFAEVPFDGKIRMLRARETFKDDKSGALSTHRIYCPTDVNAPKTGKITFKGNTYTVIKANNVMDEDALLQIDVELDE